MRSISLRLALPFLLFLAPIAFVLYYLVHTHQRGIATATNEISGIPAVEAALGSANHLMRLAGGGDAGASQATIQAALETMRKEGGNWPADRNATAKFQEALKAVGDVHRMQGLKPATIDPAITAWRASSAPSATHRS